MSPSHFGVQLLTGMIVGRLDREGGRAAERAAESEGLRDELARRVDHLDAANRCARARLLARVPGRLPRLHPRVARVVPFERVAIVLVEEGRAEVVANAGIAADTVFPPGSVREVAGAAPAPAGRRSPARASGSSSRARSPRRTASLEVRSVPRQGATFTLALPVG